LLNDIGVPTVRGLSQISPEQVLAFFTKHSQDKAPRQLRCLQGVVRSFLRFCLHQGYLERDLSQAIPRLRTYKLSDVPRAISEDDAQKTLECIDRTTAVGRRDFAIILMLYTYGVRGGQLRALQLQDIQWNQNRIRVPAAKGGKEIVLPLTEQVGDSLLEYLRHARPQVPYPEVFLTAQPPFRALRAPSTVSVIVAHRMSEAGVHAPRAGSHVFRHGFATRMLHNGQSLKAIADLLGHRNINTTFIYTKVDLAALHQLPLEWPEVSP
jgi:site-specific recombinase XerD